MAQNVWSLEWLNHNSRRSYPLAQDATQLDQTGSIALPMTFLIDLSLSISAAMDVDSAGFHIGKISIFPQTIRVEVAYTNLTGVRFNVAVAQIPRTGFVSNSTHRLRGVDAFSDAVGHVVVGKLDDLVVLGGGVFEFPLANARLEVDTIHPQIAGISSISIQDGDDLSPRYTGDIVFRPGRNMRITASRMDGYTEFVFDAIDGEGTIAECVCSDDVNAATSPPIRSISGVRPGPDGNINLNGDACITVEGSTASINLKDVCSAPCCGCDSVAELKRSLNVLDSKVVTLESFTNRVAATVDQLEMSVLSSQLRDRGCGDC